VTRKSCGLLIDQRSSGRRHQVCLPEAIPSLAGYTVTGGGIVLVLDQITDPHNVAHPALGAAFASRPCPTARHSPEATGVLAKSASALSNWCVGHGCKISHAH